MARVIKIGSQYLTSDGSLSDSQREALRIFDDLPQGANARTVRLRPAGSQTQRTPDPTDGRFRDESF